MIYSYDIANYVDILREYAREASFVLELGPAKGDGSTSAFAEGLELSRSRNKLFISVDIQDYMEVKPQLPYWKLVIGDSREESTLKKVRTSSNLARARYADIIFIDTHHTYEQMQRELQVWHKIAGPETIWLFHDTYMMGEYNHMTDAIKEFAESSKDWKYADIRNDAHGLGALLPRGTRTIAL